MTFAQRVAVRREMVKEAESLIRQNCPSLTAGAVRIQAYKFIEDSFAKEFQKQ